MLQSFIIFTVKAASKHYLDPGSGSMLIQLILGAVLGLGVVIRVFWKNIKSFFAGGKKSAEAEVDPTAIVEDSTEVAVESTGEHPTDTTI